MPKTIKNQIRDLIYAYSRGVSFDILIPPNDEMGDYSTNVAFSLSKVEKKSSVECADNMKEKLDKDSDLTDYIEKIEISPAGFINFFLKKEYLFQNLKNIISQKNKFADLDIGKGERINLEFVSANPTGPLTVGNARAASYGDALGNIFRKAGYDVCKEYYINDVGAQVEKLGESVLKALRDEDISEGDDLYHGGYISAIAEKIKAQNIEIPEDYQSAIIVCKNFAVAEMIQAARNSISSLGVQFDTWFSESSLHENGEVSSVFEFLKSENLAYEKEGAWWFRVSRYVAGQDDAVIVKSNGDASYLLGDMAYTKNKTVKRGFDRAINIWGADHHGDVPRLKAGAMALGIAENQLEVLLHQLVFIKRGGELVRMSKRKGNFVLLDDLLADVGRDAARFFFLMHDLNTHMEFDIDLAQERSKKNPVYYAQYAYARSQSIFEKIPGLEIQTDTLEELESEEEFSLLRHMAKFPDLLADISQSYQVHHLGQYALELANKFHKFYETNKVIGENTNLQSARLALVSGIADILKICFGLMGISAPEKM
ncbi:MAG: arginine--tRNA ligase [Candidatus Yanofskybacteria bacterium RIFCSPLOWO2_12_FULL_44_13b]|uniref:Arginine--tRNA ligase n=2 Tax=Candidatus Yanofskyibacteriota TaxID=1752733 RepID=A0A1F8H0V9_9BACT|nr:MAG: Arginine-tRNA ligase [Candidatus Yanofskybacteria bacterium GW2011_GWA2_44_10]KKT90386.1 MAG: Arginine-tRNA ligase [Candidatus Yanofskybacteria bacterium GW2011_GWB1_45_11]OGN02970.1 MAG: arginine--tRNA ligase [Candidatus Yanofskybacteria bacterium RIFCSPHIGHO2_01_FULL_44_110b]OGN15182.1 MAG: arginine--tRNA ligase [Candidatus Yanofskybacteria bacterium RIFCSPHIGHO2_02_FULL_44_36b]OGN18460.1 MAG: arginine--tRNA ligase [Candidatus Yanofskybacteria bacterium RIFCSPHIGHO2_12_FULL_44_29b]OG